MTYSGTRRLFLRAGLLVSITSVFAADLAPKPIIFQTQRCESTLEQESSVDYDWTLAKYQEHVARWQAQLSETFNAPLKERPSTLLEKAADTLQRGKNEIFIWWFNLNFQRKISKGFVSAPIDIQAFGEAANQLNKDLEANFLARVSEGTALKKFRGLLSRLGRTPNAYQIVEQSSSEFLDDVRAYKKKYGSELFPEETVTTAMMNVVAMRFFAKANGREIESRQAINAIALLHPVTDHLLDIGQLNKNTVIKMADILDGRTIEPAGPYEHLVFDLIANIYNEYPQDRHLLLRELLIGLHAAQMKSDGVQKRSNDFKAINASTIDKGGLATAAFGYIALGGLNPKQFEFFFRAGAIYQWMDDFSDISKDLREGSQTIWTLHTSNAQRDFMVRRLADLKDAVLEDPLVFSSFEKSELLEDFFELGFYLQMVTGIVRNKDVYGMHTLRPLMNDRTIPLRFKQDYQEFWKKFQESTTQQSGDSIFLPYLIKFLLPGSGEG